MSTSPSLSPSVLPFSLPAGANPILAYVERMQQVSSPTQPPADSSGAFKAKARTTDGVRLPKGIFITRRKGRTPTYSSTAGLDLNTKKTRRKGGFRTVEEAVKWRERTLAADAPSDREAIDFTANLSLAFGQVLLQVQKRFAEWDLRDAAQQPAGIARQAFVFTPEILDEMSRFWLKRHPKGAHGLTFGVAVDQWLEAKLKSVKRPRTITDLKDGYRFWRAGLADRRCTEITTADLEEVLKPKRSVVGGLRIRNLIAKGVDVFGWLQRIGELPAGEENNPASMIVRPTVDETTPNPFPFSEASGLLSLALQTQDQLNCLGYISICLFGGRDLRSHRNSSGEHMWGGSRIS